MDSAEAVLMELAVDLTDAPEKLSTLGIFLKLSVPLSMFNIAPLLWLSTMKWTLLWISEPNIPGKSKSKKVGHNSSHVR